MAISLSTYYPTACHRTDELMWLCRCASCVAYSDAEVANRDARFGTGRQKMALERWTNPKLQRRTRSTRNELQSCGAKSAASRNGLVSSSPSRNPYRYDSQLLHRCTAPLSSALVTTRRPEKTDESTSPRKSGESRKAASVLRRSSSVASVSTPRESSGAEATSEQCVCTRRGDLRVAYGRPAGLRRTETDASPTCVGTRWP